MERLNLAVLLTMPRHYGIFLSVILIIVAGPAVAVTHIQFLYINAGEESASGGHVALKMGDEVFHFQHVPPGLLRIRRDDYAQFRFQYATRENRTIQMHHIEVSEETLDLLRERFNRIQLIEEEQFDRLEAMENDRRLLEALMRLADQGEVHGDGANRLVVRGVGLFLPDGWHYTDSTQESTAHPVNASIARLAGQVEAVNGSDFLPTKTREIFVRLKALKPTGYAAKADIFSEDRFRSADYAFSGRYADHMAALAAIRVLALGLPLQEGSLLRPKDGEFRLNEAEKLALANYRNLLEKQLPGLLRTNRTDWGFPLLVGMARLAALDESIASGHWVFLNLAEPRATMSESEADPNDNRQGAYAASRARFFEAKSALAGIVPADEWAYSQLEQAANVFFELGKAIREGRGASLDGMESMPSKPASMAMIMPTMTSRQMQAHLESLQAYRRDYESSLANLYSYNLIGRNCASEIFRIIGLAMRKASNRNTPMDARAGPEGMVEVESTRRLGGYVSGLGVEFIPFLSFRAVGENWRVSSSETVPSYRLRRLEQVKVLENPLLAGLRESNVFSSSLYRWHGTDPAFVFFTDDLLLARPLAGGFNFAAGLSQGVYGLFTLPWDGGEHLRLGAKGSLLSLSELFFFNIRKGSFPEMVGWGD